MITVRVKNQMVEVNATGKDIGNGFEMAEAVMGQLIEETYK